MNLSRIRSILYVPGDSERKLARAGEIRADALIVDWEDAVPEPRKANARLATSQAIPQLIRRGRPVFVRLNTLGSAWFGEDCAAAASIEPDGIVLPKAEDPRELREVAGLLPARMGVLPLLESPRGVLSAAKIASCSDRVPALMFGAEDYSVAARVQRSPGEPELSFARSAVCNSARAFAKEAFDSPLMQYKDATAVRESARRGRRLGFTGQAAIHPLQVAAINQVYQPSNAEIAAAREVVRRFERHGGGVYSVQGALEDYPALREALAVLERAGGRE